MFTSIPYDFRLKQLSASLVILKLPSFIQETAALRCDGKTRERPPGKFLKNRPEDWKIQLLFSEADSACI